MHKSNLAGILIGGLSLLLILIVGAFTLAFGNSAPEKSTSGILTFSETHWSIGDVLMKDGIHQKDITVANTSGEPITITNMETSCMCTTSQVVRATGESSLAVGMPGHGATARISETIQPEESVTIVIYYDPNAHGPNATGPISRDVYIETDSLDQELVRLSFTGNVVK